MGDRLGFGSVGMGGGFGGGRDSGFGRDMHSSMSSGVSGGGGPSLSQYDGHNLYNIPVEILMELDIVPPLVNQVFVSNVSY